MRTVRRDFFLMMTLPSMVATLFPVGTATIDTVTEWQGALNGVAHLDRKALSTLLGVSSVLSLVPVNLPAIGGPSLYGFHQKHLDQK